MLFNFNHATNIYYFPLLQFRNNLHMLMYSVFELSMSAQIFQMHQ